MAAPTQIDLGILGWSDSLILMMLALVVFGPRRLPQIGRQIGKLMYEFRKASNDFKFQMEEELRSAEEADRRKKLEEERQRAEALKSADPAPQLPEPTTPYREDVVYPPAASPATAVDEPQAEDASPRILPPSTGETVSTRSLTDVDAGMEHAGSNGSIAGAQPQSEPLTEQITEQATQHG